MVQLVEYGCNDISSLFFMFFGTRSVLLWIVVMSFMSVKDIDIHDIDSDYINIINWIKEYSIGQMIIHSMIIFMPFLITILNLFIYVKAIKIINKYEIKGMLDMIFIFVIIISSIHDFIYAIMTYSIFKKKYDCSDDECTILYNFYCITYMYALFFPFVIYDLCLCIRT